MTKQTRDTRELFNGAGGAIAVAHLGQGFAVACSEGITAPSWTGNLRVWDLDTRKPMGPTISSGHADQLRPVVLCELDGKPLVGVGGRDDVRFWEVETGYPVSRLDVGRQTVHALAARQVAGDVLVIVAGVVDLPLQVWSVRGGHPVSPLWHPWNLPGNFGSPIDPVAVGSLNGNPVIAIGDRDNTVFLYDLARKEIVREVALPREAGDSITHADIRDPLLATAGSIKREPYRDRFGEQHWWCSMWIWEIAGTGRAGEYFPSGRPYGLAIGPQGDKSLVLAACDDKVNLWYPWA